MIRKLILSLSALIVLAGCGTTYLPSEDYKNGGSVNLGYGNVSKEANTYSVSSLQPDEETMSGYRDIYEYMRGRVAGVQIGHAEMGTAPKVTIRGENSINSGTDPLFIVDGMEMKDIMSISPSDVYSIDVLKDASASVYGVRGAGGVILIRTKSAVQRQKEEAAARRAARKAK